MTTTSDKYVVLKIGDWLDQRAALNAISNNTEAALVEARAGIDEALSVLDDARLSDAHVIREQDIFAAPVFHTYASAVQTAIDILTLNGLDVPDDLVKSRDHFFMAAESSTAMRRKLPDHG